MSPTDWQTVKFVDRSDSEQLRLRSTPDGSAFHLAVWHQEGREWIAHPHHAVTFSRAEGEALFLLEMPKDPLPSPSRTGLTFTWEARTVLKSGDKQSARVPMRIPEPCEIVSVMPFVYVAGEAAQYLRVPVVEAIDVSLTLDGTFPLTSCEHVATPSGGGEPKPEKDHFVSLAAIAGRRLGIRLGGSRGHHLGITFRWASPGKFNHADIRLAFAVEYRDE